MKRFSEIIKYILKHNKNKKFWKKILELRTFHKKLHDKHIEEFPNLAVFAFERISLEISIFGMYEKYALINLKKLIFDKLDLRDTYCLDIGANIGNHSVFFSKYFKQIYSFEPHPLTYDLLKFNAKNLNIVTFDYGLSDQNSTVSIATQQKTSLGSSQIIEDKKTYNGGYYIYKATIKRLDDQDFIKKLDKKISFIKIDIENHELKALKGMSKVLDLHSPIICMEQFCEEFNQDNKGNISTPSIDYLKNKSYSFFYEIETYKNWKIKSFNQPNKYRFIEIVYKFFCLLLYGVPQEKTCLKLIKKFTKKTYYQIIISKKNLINQ